MTTVTISSSDINKYIDEANLGTQLAVVPCPEAARGKPEAVVTFKQGPSGAGSTLDPFVLIDPSISSNDGDDRTVLNDLHMFLQGQLIPCGYRAMDALSHLDVFVLCGAGDFKKAIEAVFKNSSHKVEYFSPLKSTEVAKLKKKLS